MMTAKEAICRALPRSQDDFIADDILRALRDAGFMVVHMDDWDAQHAVGFRDGFRDCQEYHAKLGDTLRGI